MTVNLSTGEIDADEAIRPGLQTVAIHWDEQSVYSNLSGHDVHLLRLDGSDVQDAADWMNWVEPTGLVSTGGSLGPATFMGGAQTMTEGSTAYFTVNLRPGEYAWTSEVPALLEPQPHLVPRAAGWLRCVLLALLIGLCASSLGPPPALAQSLEAGEPVEDTLVVPRLEGPVQLDGRIGDGEWTGARLLKLRQSRPDFGAEPSRRTEVLLGYTETHVYVACRCYDAGEPVAPSFKRDFAGWSDLFQIVLDTFDDNENALGFATSPTGLRLDLAVRNDATGDYPLDIDWNTLWEVEVVYEETGWFAEMRIPVSSLRFEPDEKGRVVMGLTAMRFIMRNSEIATFPAIPPEWGTFSHMKPSQAQAVVFEHLEPATPLRVTPYVLAGVGKETVLDAAGTQYRTETEPTYDVGLDLKYGVSSNLTVDLTLNTDFAQVEADNQQVNLTRFSLFFPEKRRFFLERASNFAFTFGGQNRLFHSRRIGVVDGEEVRILGGARLVGRAGPWDIGVLSLQTAREPGLGRDGGTLPSENFSVARFRRRVLNDFSYVGAILTSRVDLDGGYNAAYGVDGILRPTGDEYLSVKWAQTFREGAANRVSSLDRARLLLQWERRRYTGLNYALSFARAGPEYRPGIGFELREDYVRLGEHLGYGWLPGDESAIQAHRLRLQWNAFFRNGDGSLESLSLGPQWELETNSGHRVTAEGRHRVEDLRTPFQFTERVAVPAGRYAFQEGEVSYATPGGRTLRGRISATAGAFFDGGRGSLVLRPSWNVSRYFRLQGSYQLDRVEFGDRDQGFTSHVARLRIEFTPNVRYSLQPFIQYSSLNGLALANIRFRYNPREGNDLYVVLNERLNTDGALTDPHLPFSSGRTLLLKYSYTFDW